MQNVLIFPSDTEIAREIFDSLKYNKLFSLIGASSTNGKGELLNYNKHINNLPFISDTDFILTLNQRCIEYNIQFIFPCHDDVCYFLTKHKSEISARIVSHSFRINQICRSKEQTYMFLHNENYLPKINPSDFPMFVKPKEGYGSKNVRKVENSEELDYYFKQNSYQNSIVCEYLPHEEYTVDCFSISGELIFHGARNRRIAKMGIAEISEKVIESEISDIALRINNKFKQVGGFHGAWFFQLKKDVNDQFKLLEIGPRISGGMSFYRMSGDINFAEASISILNSSSFNLPSHSKVNIKKFGKYFIPLFKFEHLNFDNVYVDFDDTLFLHSEKIMNTELIMFLYQCVNENKKIILITRSKFDFIEILKRYKLFQLFDEIIHITDGGAKANFIRENSVFIDDSFKERNFFHETIHCFGIDNFKVLIRN